MQHPPWWENTSTIITPERGWGGGLLGSVFPGDVPLAFQEPNPIIVSYSLYSVASALRDMRPLRG